MISKTIFIFFLLFIFANFANAAIYKCKQSDGSVRYMDRPCLKGSKTERIKNLRQAQNAIYKDLDAPVYPGAEVSIGEEMESSKKGTYILNVTLQVRDDPKKVLAFYSNHTAIKKCEKNNMNTNHMCRFSKYKRISSGDLFVDNHQKNGKVEVYMSYFYKK